MVAGTHLNVNVLRTLPVLFICGMGWADVVLQMQPLILTTVHPPDDRWMNVEHKWYDRLQEKSEFLVENPFPYLIFPPQILHVPPREWTWVNGIRILGYGRPT